MIDHRKQPVEASIACIQIALDDDRAYVEHRMFRLTLTATFTVANEVDVVLFKISENGKTIALYRDEEKAIIYFLGKVGHG